MTAANIFTISPGVAFLERLAEAVVWGELFGHTRLSPLELARATIYLPSSRACRAMRPALLKACGGQATLLPALLTLGADDDAASILGDAPPDAIAPLDRRMALANLILAWAKRLGEGGGRAFNGEPLFVEASPAAAAGLAAEFIALLDEAQTQGVDLRRLADCAPAPFARHWQLSAEFLAILSTAWPQLLDRLGVIEPIEARNRRMAQDAARIAGGGAPVVIAGSTGSIAATEALMRAALASPMGAVVLPGLDKELDDAAWSVLPPEHPQYGLARLLAALSTPRSAVRELAPPPPHIAARLRLLRAASRPAAAGPVSGVEADFNGLSDVSLIEAPTPQAEAAAVALVIRRTAETPGRTAALVTADRDLARRVCAQLKRWGLDIEDSAGKPLGATSPGAILTLILDAQSAAAAPALVALLRHPLTRLGYDEAAVAECAHLLDLAVFRVPGVRIGASSLPGAVKRARAAASRHPAQKRLTPDDWERAAEAARRIMQAFAPLAAVRGAALSAFARAHLETAALLSASAGGETFAAWSGPDCDAALRFMRRLADERGMGPAMGARDYPALFRQLLAAETVARPASLGRFAILSPLEARLQRPDVIILGGLNEGAWPQACDPGPWLNRAMRAELGFAPPERRIGQAAHDFVEAFGCPEAYLTRAAKADGAPTSPCRWLMRMKAALIGAGLDDALAPREPWAAWTQSLDAAAHKRPAVRPEPRPPVDARPRTLTVTEIEKLIANPYAIYARRILALEPLPPARSLAAAAEKGKAIHMALGRFSDMHPETLPENAAAVVFDLAAEQLAKLGDHDAARAFWLPRLRRFAGWFAQTEAERRAGVARVIAEAPGEIRLDAPAGPFTLVARADRIDVTAGGRLRIYDYKTGSAPKGKDVDDLRAPQLPLEAAIAAQGGFAAARAGTVESMAFILAKGGEPPGEERRAGSRDPMELGAEALAKLAALIRRFDNAATPYPPLRREAFASLYRFDDYAHLARVAAWSSAEEGDAE
ncbi:MAG: double-strand break repair protein AddB [Hyphomicrobiales bacterium]|nr:double-strand break repair protein AddB [Hyphomicrobiales bacterium]